MAEVSPQTGSSSPYEMIDSAERASVFSQKKSFSLKIMSALRLEALMGWCDGV